MIRNTNDSSLQLINRNLPCLLDSRRFRGCWECQLKIYSGSPATAFSFPPLVLKGNTTGPTGHTDFTRGWIGRLRVTFGFSARSRQAESMGQRAWLREALR